VAENPRQGIMKTEFFDSGAVDESRAKAAERIAVEASQLARVANTNGFGLLSHLIDMVVLEAWREATEPGSPPSDLTFPSPETN
jgi:hypothetical protein